MKRRTSVLPLAVVTLAGGLLLTACGGSSSADSASATGSASASAATDGASGSDTSSDSSSSDSSSGSDSVSSSSSGSDSGSSSNASSGTGGSGSSASGGGAAAQAGACHTADLSFSYGPDSGAQSVGSPGAVVVKMTNKGSAACSMTGYPGVDLTGGGVTWSLSRQTSVAPHTVSVQPGASTSFTITYLPFAKGSGEQVDVKTIVITPPNETHSAQLAWDFQPVLRQDGATHPGTFVGPVGGK